MNRHTLNSLTAWILACLLGAFAWIIAPAPAYAHRPHDVVTQVVLSPFYDQDNTVYSLVRNSLMRSQDSGETWLRLNHGLDSRAVLKTLTISAGDRPVLYATTADAGLYHSEDGGDTWQPANTGLDSLELQWVEAAADNPQLAFTQTLDGRLYRTADSGANWSPVLENVAATTVAFGPDKQLLILGDDQGLLWQSDDSGLTWQQRTQLADVGRIQSIAIAPAANEETQLYVGTELAGVFTAAAAGGGFTAMNQGLSDLLVQNLLIAPDRTLMISTWTGGVWHWDDAQQQWQQQDTGLTRDKMADDTNVPHFGDLAVSPTYATDQAMFLGGFDGLFRSQDSGQTWAELETLSLGTVIALAVSPTFRADQTLAIATYVGELYLSQDAGETWQAINQDLSLPRFTRNFKPLNISAGDQDPRRFFDLVLSSNYAQDQSLFSSILYTKILSSANSGQTWNVSQLSKEVRGVSLAVSPDFARDRTLFSTNQKGLVYRSRDGGQQFRQVGKLDKQPGNDSPSLVVSPDFANDQTLFNTGLRGVYKSEDAGETWSLLTAATDIETTPGLQIALSPNFAIDQTLFVGSRAGLFRTQDGGNTWESLPSSTYGATPLVEAIAVSPNFDSDGTVMMSVRGRGLYRSRDGGNSFTAVGNADLAFSRMTSVPSAGKALQFSPNYAEDNTLFGFGAATTAIYRSTDGGDTWQVLDIPRLKISDVPPLSTAGKAQLIFQFHRQKIAKVGLLVLVIAGAAGTLRTLSQRRVITFPIQAVQSASQNPLPRVPTWLKGVVIALVVVRLVFSLGYLANKPYNADEVRGFYRLSGHLEADVRKTAFQGQIHQTQDLRDYQIPTEGTTVGGALASLADYPEHPPLYDIVTRYWMKLWQDPMSARVLSVLLGVAYIPCAYWLCLELFQSAWAGWVSMALLSLSPYHLLLAQGAREYSLWTILLLSSSALLLRCLRQGNGWTWAAYGATVAVGLYSHLFFAFLLIAHGLYMMIFEWPRWRSHLVPFILSSSAGVLAFGPWLWVVVTRLDTIDENTQWVRGRNSSVINITRAMLERMGDLFINLNSANLLDRGGNVFLWALIALAFYCLIRWNPSRIWAFLVLPVVVNLTLLAVPDLVSGGGRSLQSRYLVPALLSVTLTVAFFLANAMKRSKYHWEKLAWTGIFTGILVLGFSSGLTVTRASGFDYLEQGRTASVVNQELAPLINASDNPLVLSAATHSFALALSHEVHSNVNFQLVQNLPPEDWAAVIDLNQAQATYSDVFVYFPDQTFLTFLEETFGADLEPVFEKRLYHLTS